MMQAWSSPKKGQGWLITRRCQSICSKLFLECRVSRTRSIVRFSYNDTFPDDPAAILFTSGSTGSPKGVVYTHEMFSRQLEVLRSCYKIQPGEIDLSTFPLFSLLGVGIGMTSILPKMDFTRPAKVNPEKILNTITKDLSLLFLQFLHGLARWNPPTQE